MTLCPSPPPLEVFLLGCVPVADVLRFQRRMAYDLGETERSAALILCEHPPTITVGRAGSRAHIRPDDDALRAAGIPVQWVNRGGGCVLHQPGQLAAYPLLPLRGLGLDLWSYVGGLHSAIQAVLREFDLEGTTYPDAAGVFLGHARVATIGVAVNRWITTFGVTLNVGPYLGPFELLDEPGRDGWRLRQTSMEARRQRPASMSRVRSALIAQLESAFGLERNHVYTDHPLMPRKGTPHAVATSLR